MFVGNETIIRKWMRIVTYVLLAKMALRGSASADPIGDVQRHLSVYSKQIADTLYYAKEMKREDDVRVSLLAYDLRLIS